MRYEVAVMNEGTIGEEPVHPQIQVQTREIDGFSYIAAEVRSLRQSGVTRDHLRIIGLGKRAISGHPLVYSDTYLGTRDDEILVYSRHRVDQKNFFSRLDSFLEKTLSDFSELAGKPLHFSLQVDGEFIEAEIPLPLVRNLEIPPGKIDFARLSIKLGDIAIEFSSKPIVSAKEQSFTKKGVLRRRLESPLFGFDASRSDIWAPFLADIHWASGMIPRRILQSLIQSAAPVKA
jgi:hypothetical protein